MITRTFKTPLPDSTSGFFFLLHHLVPQAQKNPPRDLRFEYISLSYANISQNVGNIAINWEKIGFVIEKKLDLIDVFEIFVDEKRVSPFKNSD